ncbi:MAG: 3-deoxy-manno-octulosonate cytidylyltransferase [Casimicrobiaceae bacterium]
MNSALEVEFDVVIPARFRSSRLPGKPLLDLGGQPVVVRVAGQARRSGAARVIVATDDDRIEAACAAHGIEVARTSVSHETGTDRLAEVAARLELPPDRVVVNVQGDEPFLPPEAIDRVARLLVTHPQAALATLCHPIHAVAEITNPNVVKVVLSGLGEAICFSRAPIPWARDAWGDGITVRPADLPIYRHIGLYAYRAHFLRAFPGLARPALERHESLEQLRALWHGYRIACEVIEAPLPPGIDTPEDYAAAVARFSEAGFRAP